MQKTGFNGPVRDQVGFLIKRVQQALRARMDEALSENGLTTSQYAVLSHLRETPSLSNAELARRSFVTAPTMIRIVQDLERLGFVKKAESKIHRKVVDVNLTPEGKRVLDLCESVVQAIQQQMLLGLSASEVDQLSKLLVFCAERLEFKVGRDIEAN